jgi:hypothetical protein
MPEIITGAVHMLLSFLQGFSYLFFFFFLIGKRSILLKKRKAPLNTQEVYRASIILIIIFLVQFHFG